MSSYNLYIETKIGVNLSKLRTEIRHRRWSVPTTNLSAGLLPPHCWPRPWPLRGSHARPDILQAGVRCGGGKHCNHRDDPKKIAKTKGDMIHMLFRGLLFLWLWNRFWPSQARVLHPASHEVVLCLRLAWRGGVGRDWRRELVSAPPLRGWVWRRCPSRPAALPGGNAVCNS